jgi:hypothetical protein
MLRRAFIYKAAKAWEISAGKQFERERFFLRMSVGPSMRGVVFLIAASLSLGSVDIASAGSIRDRDASTQREVATGRASPPCRQGGRDL